MFANELNLEFDNVESFIEFADEIEVMNERELSYYVLDQAASDLNEVYNDKLLEWINGGGDINADDADIISELTYRLDVGPGNDNIKYDDWRVELGGIGLKYARQLDMGGSVSIWQHMGDDFIDPCITELIAYRRNEQE